MCLVSASVQADNMWPLMKTPSKYVLACLGLSIGGLMNGYDTGSIGAITSMPQFSASIGSLTPTLIGITVSMILLTGIIPSIFVGHLADKIGRLPVIAPGAILFGLGSILQAASHSLAQFLVGRSIAGIGQGVFLSNVSVYICEIAPVRHRGALSGLPQFMATAGIVLGYFTCYGSVDIASDWAWRLPFVVQTFLSLALTAACRVAPESPRWLLMHGRREDAASSLTRLDINGTEERREILSANDQANALSPWQGFLLLFRRAYRARTILALFILGMVQLSGIDAVVYYAPTLFRKAGLSSDSASFLASGVSAILMFAISIPGFLLADKWGRRTSALTGGIILSSCMFLMGSLYAAGVVHADGIARWFVILAVFVFGLTYCATWGIVGKIYASEIQPGNTRAAANCVALGLSFFTNWLVAILAPILLDASSFAAYFLFGILALGTVIVLAAYMPETRGRTLEDIQEAFHRPALSSLTSSFQQIVPFRRRRAPPTESSMELDTRNASSSGSANSASVATPAISMRLGLTA
ncbi:putative MFS sugar transporter [Xylariaceae sp. FL1272]|nr:putative MFS sugar transporter [Xylariaceae sp. FL1272]